MYARCVSCSLTVEYKTKRNAISSVFLSRVEAEEEASLSLIVTLGETFAHYFDQRQKGHPWNGPILNCLVEG